MGSEIIIAVPDFETKDANFKMIEVEAKVGGQMDDSMLVKGVIAEDDKKSQIQRLQIRPSIKLNKGQASIKPNEVWSKSGQQTRAEARTPVTGTPEELVKSRKL